MTINHVFACDQRAEEVSRLAKEILSDALVMIQLISLKLTENFETTKAQFDAKVIEISSGKPKSKMIHGEGVGFIDACFDAMIRSYNNDYCSLETIAIVDFTVNAHIAPGNNRKSDAKVTTVLRVKNSENHEYTFECTTSSISHSSIAVVQESIAFFINAELAYKRLHHALKDAQERGRHDLVAKYQHQMGTLVNATSYENLVVSLRNRKE
jgi:hypothetical protein